VEPLAALSAAVVRALLKLWLNDDAVTGLAGDLTDLIAARFPDAERRRRTKHLFDGVQYTVSDRLTTVLDTEFRDVPANERDAALIAVGTTLDRAHLTGPDLFAADLDPIVVERRFHAAREDAVRDLAPGARALYDLALSIACAYVVELARELPGFHTDAYATLLTRLTRTQGRLDDLLRRVPTPEAAVAGADRDAERFLVLYRQAVAHRLDRLKLFGVTLAEPLVPYSMSTAYISLAVDSPAVRDRLADRRDTGRFGGHAPLGDLRCEEALSGTNRLFLRGAAGTGKTTLLQWIAVRAARHDFPEMLSAWNDTVPFLIRLRRYVRDALPAPEEFVTEVAKNYASEMPKGWVRELLEAGRALVLVDGIDELPEERRPALREWLSDLIADFPGARYVVTTRPGAVTEDWLIRDDFDAAELQRMSPADIRRFVRHWHEAYGDTAEHESKLLKAIESRSHLRELADTPLLCALL